MSARSAGCPSPVTYATSRRLPAPASRTPSQAIGTGIHRRAPLRGGIRPLSGRDDQRVVVALAALDAVQVDARVAGRDAGSGSLCDDVEVGDGGTAVEHEALLVADGGDGRAADGAAGRQRAPALQVVSGVL